MVSVMICRGVVVGSVVWRDVFRVQRSRSMEVICVSRILFLLFLCWMMRQGYGSAVRFWNECVVCGFLVELQCVCCGHEIVVV